MTCDLVSELTALLNTRKLIKLPSPQERPCTRCVKRNIGHLCHDEPRESVKKSKSEPENPDGQSDAPQNGATISDNASSAVPQQTSAPDAGLNLGAAPLLPPNRVNSTTSIAPSDPVSAAQLPSLTSSSQSCKLHLLSAPYHACN